jgi:hypothetical protein
MRIDGVMTPMSLTWTIAGWSRAEIETAIEQLISLLDATDAADDDREPDPEGEVDSRLPGDPDDAEENAPIPNFRITRRLR